MKKLKKKKNQIAKKIQKKSSNPKKKTKLGNPDQSKKIRKPEIPPEKSGSLKMSGQKNQEAKKPFGKKNQEAMFKLQKRMFTTMFYREIPSLTSFSQGFDQNWKSVQNMIEHYCNNSLRPDNNFVMRPLIFHYPSKLYRSDAQFFTNFKNTCHFHHQMEALMSKQTN